MVPPRAFVSSSKDPGHTSGKFYPATGNVTFELLRDGEQDGQGNGYTRNSNGTGIRVDVVIGVHFGADHCNQRAAIGRVVAQVLHCGFRDASHRADAWTKLPVVAGSMEADNSLRHLPERSISRP